MINFYIIIIARYYTNNLLFLRIYIKQIIFLRFMNFTSETRFYKTPRVRAQEDCWAPLG